MPLWIYAPMLLSVYLCIIVGRFWVRRLPFNTRVTQSVRAASYVVLTQLVLYGLFLVLWHFQIVREAIFALCVIQVLMAVLLLASTVRTWRHMKPRLGQPLTDQELPSISVLVPARNETIDLQNCLQALIDSNYPKLEIIALDDCSTNRRTPEIIRGFAHEGVRFIAGDEPTSHMLPKNHAYARLASEASGDILVFIGVDVLVRPDALRRLVESMLSAQKDMVSLLPMRPEHENRVVSPIQTMRYWWELGWPRRLFRRPPVLSTLWAVRADALKKYGGFAAAAQMITPEAYFAKQLVRSDLYSFLRATPTTIGVYSTKSAEEQFATAVRVRYPQLHRRIELVMFVSVFELIFLLLPFLLLPYHLAHVHTLLATLNAVVIAALTTMYYLIGVRTKVNYFVWGLLTTPVAFLLDVIVLHSSMWAYEFGHVSWHERTLTTRPMLEAIRKFPDA